MRNDMSKPSKMGRPRGRRKFPTNLSLDSKLAGKFKRIAFEEGISFSCYIERLMRDKLTELNQD